MTDKFMSNIGSIINQKGHDLIFKRLENTPSSC